MNRPLLATVLTTLPVLLATTAIAAPTFRGLNAAGNSTWSIALDVSADGSTILGAADNSYRLWGLTGAPVDTTVAAGQAAAGFLSANGSTVVGTSYASGPPRPFRWTAAGGFQFIGTSNGDATAVNADGTVVAGTQSGGSPFRWNSTFGFSLLWFAGVPRGLSSDGNQVVGTSPQSRATTWKLPQGFHDRPPLTGTSEGMAMSTDTTIVAGTIHYAANVSVRWVNDGWIELGNLAGMNQSAARDMSADGQIIVGTSSNSNNGTSIPYIWSPSTRLLSVTDFLTQRGINLTGWTIRSVEAISPDGVTIVGTGIHDGVLDGWAATVPLGCYADVGVQGGSVGADNALDNNDFIAYIALFFTSDPRADRGIQGGLPGTDGSWDNNDFIVFINQFFMGC